MVAASEETVYAALKRVLDPEIGLNIVDLGLIYALNISADGDVEITMTLTTPGCPLHDAIDQAVQRALGTVDGVREISTNLVWSPPWSPELISEQGRVALGWS